MTKVLYIGNYRHAHCTEVHLTRDLENLGHEVIRLQEDPEWHLYDEVPRELDDTVEDHLPDLVMWTRTWGLPPSTTKFWRELEERGIVTASYHLDLYFGLARDPLLAPGSGDPFWTTQYVFSPDGNKDSEQRFSELGINHHWMPPAIVSDECVPGVVRPEWEYDVIFVGSRNYHREWPWRRELVDGLTRRYRDRFRHFGHSWESTVRTGLHDGIEEDGLWLNDLYASAKVVVGDSLNLPGNTKYISDRYFEVMGRGGCLVAPYVPVLDSLGFSHMEHLMLYERLSREGQTVGYATGLNGIFESIDLLLDHPTLRADLRENAQSFVASSHTYKHRLAAALEVMGLS